MTQQIISKTFFSFFIAIVLFGCKNSDKADENQVEVPVENNSLKDKEMISAQNVFNSIPARADIINLISQDKIEYDAEFLNNPDNASKYALENSRALNLGVYGADLSVTGAFDQTAESMVFLKCVNILSKNLGVSTAFDQTMMDRMEMHKENRDSTLEIIAQSFRKADDYLKQNDRPGTSALIICGAWIEGMHVSCKIAEHLKAENTIRTILKQEESLKHLIIMAEASNLNAEGLYVLDGLKSIQGHMKSSIAKNELTLENIKPLAESIAKLRKKVVETF